MNYRGWIGACASLLVLAGTGSAQIVVISNSVEERTVEAGQSYSGHIQLRNQGTAAKEVRVYQTDYLFHADGRSEYSAPGSHARSSGQWLQLSPASLVVPGGEAAEISYTVTVPRGDDVAGTYWSMVMVEPVEPAAAAAGTGQVGVRSVVRFGIQLATHVSGGNQAHLLRLGKPRLTVADDGSRTFEIELLNDGPVGYRPKVTLELYDSKGSLALKREAQRGLVYPGTSVMQRFALGPIAPGDYEALLVIDTGSPEMFGGQFKLAVGRGQ